MLVAAPFTIPIPIRLDEFASVCERLEVWFEFPELVCGYRDVLPMRVGDIACVNDEIEFLSFGPVNYCLDRFDIAVIVAHDEKPVRTHSSQNGVANLLVLLNHTGSVHLQAERSLTPYRL